MPRRSWSLVADAMAATRLAQAQRAEQLRVLANVGGALHEAINSPTVAMVPDEMSGPGICRSHEIATVGPFPRRRP